MKCIICEKWLNPTEIDKIKPFKHFWGFYHIKCMEDSLKKDFPSLYKLLNNK